jgi:SAM-dependent methyltransferase
VSAELQAAPARCPGCGSDRFTRVGEASVADLGRAWATDRAVGESRGAPVAPGRLAELAHDWAARIRKAIGADAVAVHRCEACGLEVSVPCRCWPEGEYTEDENYPARWEFGRFLDDLGPGPLRVLELGAGRGTFLEMAVRRGHRAVGVDFTPTAVAFARARGLEVIGGGFNRLRQHLTDQSGGPFDAVAMFHVIEHLPDPAEVLSGLGEFVRPGTRLGISCPGPRRFTRLIGVQQVGGRDFWDYPPHHVLRWTPEALRAVLAKVGWEVVATAEEPLDVRAAASQIGVARALWRGYLHRRWWRRAGIALARLRVLAAAAVGPVRGLSLYTLARYRGG